MTYCHFFLLSFGQQQTFKTDLQCICCLYQFTDSVSTHADSQSCSCLCMVFRLQPRARFPSHRVALINFFPVCLPQLAQLACASRDETPPICDLFLTLGIFMAHGECVERCCGCLWCEVARQMCPRGKLPLFSSPFNNNPASCAHPPELDAHINRMSWEQRGIEGEFCPESSRPNGIWVLLKHAEMPAFLKGSKTLALSLWYGPIFHLHSRILQESIQVDASIPWISSQK